MTQDETLALWAECETARAEAKAAGASDDAAHDAATRIWNAWAEARLAERRVLEASGEWKTKAIEVGRGSEPANYATRAWMEAAKAVFSTSRTPWKPTGDVICSGWTFPWSARFKIATFQGTASFRGTTFRDDALFDGTTFEGLATFGNATFEGETLFDDATFEGAFFDDATFEGEARFRRTTFKNEILFDGATFEERVYFGGVRFVGETGVRRTTFKNEALFYETTFGGEAWFDGTTFERAVWFRNTVFESLAWFRSTMFEGQAEFGDAKFEEEAWFGAATFKGEAGFRGTMFERGAWFGDAIFKGEARFRATTFKGEAGFRDTVFKGEAWFRGATFKGEAGFGGATFEQEAWFTQVIFEGFTNFGKAQFDQNANFAAIQCSKAFSIDNTRFARPPDFIQAHFLEPLRLDNIQISGWRIEPGRLWTWPQRFVVGHRERCLGTTASDEPVRFQWLRKLAKSANDHEHEQAFFAAELHARRGVKDFPWPSQMAPGASNFEPSPKWLRHISPAWRARLSPAAWSSFARYWIGKTYGLTSDYGRSVWRPFVGFVAVLMLSALCFLAQVPEVSAKRAEAAEASWFAPTNWAWVAGFNAWRASQPCTAGLPDVVAEEIEADPSGKAQVTKLTTKSGWTGLREPVRSRTSAASEAFSLALASATLFGGGESTHRMYGCLYGVEKYEDNPVAVVPATVGRIVAFQKVLSAFFIFLFGLSVRNMLKMK